MQPNPCRQFRHQGVFTGKIHAHQLWLPTQTQCGTIKCFKQLSYLKQKETWLPLDVTI